MLVATFGHGRVRNAARIFFSQCWASLFAPNRAAELDKRPCCWREFSLGPHLSKPSALRRCSPRLRRWLQRGDSSTEQGCPNIVDPKVDPNILRSLLQALQNSARTSWKPPASHAPREPTMASLRNILYIILGIPIRFNPYPLIK